MTDTPALPPPATPPTTPVPDPSPDVTTAPAAARRGSAWPVVGVIAFILLAGAIFYVWENPQTPDAHTADLGPLEARIGALEQRPAAAPGAGPDVKQIEARLSALEQKAPAAPPDLSRIEARLNALEQKAPTQESASKADLVALATRVDALSGRVDQMATQMQGQTTASAGRLDKIDKQLGTLPDLAAKVQDLEQKIGTLNTAAGQLPALAARATRVARLQAAQTALESGQPIGKLDGAPPELARYADTAPPTEASLRLAFPAAARAAEEAGIPPPEDAGFFDRSWLRAQSIFTVRRGDHVLVGNAAAAPLATARQRLDAGDLAGAVQALGPLSGPAATAMAGWLDQARGLLAARAALAAMAAHA